MEIKWENFIKILFSFIVEFMIIFVPMHDLLIIFQRYNPIYFFFFTVEGYFYLDIQILGILLIVYSVISQIEALKGKKIISLGAMIFGGILVLFPLMAISLNVYAIYLFYEEIFFWVYFGPILSLVLLVPGVALCVHGWFLKKIRTNKEEKKLIAMKIKERDAIIGIMSFLVGVFLLSNIVLELIVNSQYFLSQAFIRLYGYYNIDLFILAMILFFYAFFLLKPMKTLRGKKILTLGEMISGGILIFFLIVAIGFELNYRSFYRYRFSVIDTLNFFLCIVILLPGMSLLIHGWVLRKSLNSEEKKGLIEMGLERGTL